MLAGGAGRFLRPGRPPGALRAAQPGRALHASRLRRFVRPTRAGVVGGAKFTGSLAAGPLLKPIPRKRVG
jgi:hypothetical protein